jgi:hypothetical protein
MEGINRIEILNTKISAGKGRRRLTKELLLYINIHFYTDYYLGKLGIFT